jgi:hypothetical protein
MLRILKFHCNDREGAGRLGMREIELDAFYDPKGGLFGSSAAVQLAGTNGTFSDSRYYQPGSKVSTFLTFHLNNEPGAPGLELVRL